MLRSILCILAIISLSCPTMVLAMDKYEIDPNHASIQFSIKHLDINFVTGRFDEFTGTLLSEKDPNQLSAKVVIQVASIDTGVKARDEHLRSPDFFDVQKYPTITFEANKVEIKEDQSYLVGTLTMHGIQKEVKFNFKSSGPIKDPWGKTRLGIHATTLVNRLEFGIAWSKTLENGGLMVGDLVKIEINVEAVKNEG